MTLTEFLTARLDEDEAAARAGERSHPARWLREVEAKRAILASVQWYRDNAGRGSVTMDGYTLAEQHAKALAAVYADNSDYREEWRP